MRPSPHLQCEVGFLVAETVFVADYEMVGPSGNGFEQQPQETYIPSHFEFHLRRI